MLRAEVYPYHYDLGEEWRTVTGLPMVFAVCAARREFAAARPAAAAAVGAALLASRDVCAAHPARDGGRRGAALRLQPALPARVLRQAQVRFTPEYRAGLEEFYRRAAAIGELVAAPISTPPCSRPTASEWPQSGGGAEPCAGVTRRG